MPNIDFKARFKLKCEEFEQVMTQLKNSKEKLNLIEEKLNSQNRKTDGEKVNLLRSMNILKEEIKEKDLEIKALEEQKNEGDSDLIQKTLISKPF